MRNLIAFLLLFCASSLSGQQADKFTDTNSDRTRDPRADQMNFVPNEVLLKFKDEVILKAGTSLKSVGISAVDHVLMANGAAGLEKLFPTAKRLKSARIVKDPQGRDMQIPNLDNIYKIVIAQTKSTGSAPVDLFKIIEELKVLPEVEYAEPNYIYSVDNLDPVGPVLTADDVAALKKENLKSSPTGMVPNDPLYGQQWYIPAVKADLVWNQTTGDTTQIIAILDTGVDWNHPDLKNKIWCNEAEIPGNGIDDDGNGLIDDIRGWDYINNDNNPMDDNSHGTHVAGIAAAETNNGIGIAGVNWKAKILPLKVFQSSGRGDAATIAMGITYAANKGATVINMSFGSYARSLAMEDALANAYATTILVAAAGNDDLALESCFPVGQFFPAALSFVLGVQVPEAQFSNYDCNGPTFSQTSDLLNYEMKAPGTNIISTIPNGNYRIYQGTSMAAPIVSAALSLYRKLIPSENETYEFMWVKLIQATGLYLDISKALTIVPKPEVRFLNNVMVDTLGTDDKDGRVDAGETIQLWFRARNTGGQEDSVYWKISLAEFEDTSTCKIVKPTSYLGSISPYATRTNEKDPMKFIVSNNVAHDRDITFDLSSWYKGSADTLRQKFVFTSENGKDLSGVMDSTLVLTPNKLWLVNESFRIASNGTLYLKPGTHLILNKNIVNHGKIIGVGKPDSLVYITGPGTIFEQMNYGEYLGRLNFSYTRFYGINSAICADSITIHNSFLDEINCLGWWENLFNYTGAINAEDNLITNSTFSKLFSCGFGVKPVHFKRNNVYNCFLTNNTSSTNKDYVPLSFNNFVKIKDYYEAVGLKSNAPLFLVTSAIPSYNNFISFGVGAYVNYAFSGEVINLPSQYWGTTQIGKIKKMNWDFWSDANLPMLNYSPILIHPSDSAHAVVWKVLVNGKDAQDEIVDPVGEGKQRFDVYFNKTMDKTITPKVAFGVRYPFSSNVVNENGSWSADGLIYTTYKTVKLFTGDGINRIRVTGAKDLEGWEIPIEDMRFEFLISAAASASAEFMATPGLGKVKMEWNNNNLADGLGFNMYRMEHINDSVLTKPVLINSTLITDTLYTDYAVTPNKKYYYYYKILRTNLSETDSSKVVSAIPFTASKGDANGDLNVNVLDITTIVAYLLNNGPAPFITEAADYNSDGNINVLDIVGVVNFVLNGGKKSGEIGSNQQIHLYVKNDTLFANSPVAIGGFQFEIGGAASIDEIQKLKALEGFESGYSQQENGLRLLYFSMSGKSIPVGEAIPLLKLKKGTGLTEAIFADKTGTPIPYDYLVSDVGKIIFNPEQLIAELGQNYPNPLSRLTTIPVRIYELIDEAVIRVYNSSGQELRVIRLPNPIVGEHLLQWDSGLQKGLFVYRLEVRQGNKQIVCPARKMLVR